MKLIGHREPREKLKFYFRSSPLSDAFIFYGQKGVGKRTCAVVLAQSLLCSNGKILEPCEKCEECIKVERGTHTSVIKIGEEEALNITREEILSALEELRYKAGGKTRFVIIDNAERLNPASSNLLLKTLEDPPPKTFFILITAELHSILPTIRSRCKHLYFPPLSDGEVKEVLENIAGVEVNDELLSIAEGSPGTAVRFATDLSREMELIGEIKDFLLHPDVEKMYAISRSISSRRSAIELLEMLRLWLLRVWSAQRSDRRKTIYMIERVGEAIRELNRNANQSITFTRMLIDLAKISSSS